MGKVLDPKRILWTALFLFALSLVGCEPSVSASYYKYSIALKVNGQPLTFSQYIECSHVIAPTEGPGGPFHLRWKMTGDGNAAVRIDSNRILFFTVQPIAIIFRRVPSMNRSKFSTRANRRQSSTSFTVIRITI